LQLAGLGWPLQHIGELQQPMLGFQSSAWSSFWGSFGIMAAGQALMSFTGIIDQFFAAHLGAGAISTLSYANRIVSLLLALGATAISRATLPIFSELSGQGKAEAVKLLALRWASLMFLFGLIAMVVAWLMAPWMVRLLFQRGAFTAEDTLTVSKIIRYLLLQVPFYFPSILFVSLLASQQRYIVIQLVASSNLLIKIVFILLLMPTFGIYGIVLSTSIMYVTATLLMFLFLKRKNS
jgi:peptidoglycan biosynthesis protein MviN/MurJ (putative lipid II flippase)